MKIDPYKHKEKYLKWKEKVSGGIPELDKINSEIILQYLNDMEQGLNVSSLSKKGARSYIRLNNLKQRLVFLSKVFEKRFSVTLVDLKEEQIFRFFTDMRNGTVTRLDGGVYKSVCDYVHVFKAFWHWHMKVNRKQGKQIIDITIDLDISKEKPKWVYLTEEQIKRLCSRAKFEYRVLIMFLFDTGIRSPSELVNIKVSDLYNDCKELFIRDEISKTFGRKIKLMICSELLKEYIFEKHLGNDDYLFKLSPTIVNRYLKRLALNVLGDKKSLAGEFYSKLTMYDFRHCACCYWLPRYKSESALKYRFGWKKSDKIHYYSELLGMKDTISEEDLLIDVTKTDIEKRLEKSERDKELMNEELSNMREQMKEILGLVNRGEMIVVG